MSVNILNDHPTIGMCNCHLNILASVKDTTCRICCHIALLWKVFLYEYFSIIWCGFRNACNTFASALPQNKHLINWIILKTLWNLIMPCSCYPLFEEVYWWLINTYILAWQQILTSNRLNQWFTPLHLHVCKNRPNWVKLGEVNWN